MTTLKSDSGIASAAYRLFCRVHRDGHGDIFGKTILTIQGHKFKTWTSRRDAKTGIGHRVLNLAGKGWKFSFTAYHSQSERYDLKTIHHVHPGAIICVETANAVLIYDFTVDNEDALAKELVILRMFEEINDEPLETWSDDGED